MAGAVLGKGQGNQAVRILRARVAHLEKLLGTEREEMDQLVCAIQDVVDTLGTGDCGFEPRCEGCDYEVHEAIARMRFLGFRSSGEMPGWELPPVGIVRRDQRGVGEYKRSLAEYQRREAWVVSQGGYYMAHFWARENERLAALTVGELEGKVQGGTPPMAELPPPGLSKVGRRKG